mmetsp:Transcript_814/g.1409  ORF Transcript_814/g.1409 Transcript_814/m.1409 type:complete len:719 (+) Transcript_814:202-2358(+)
MHLSSFCLASILASAASFSTHRPNSLGVTVSRIKQQSSRTDQGWNNDNFLDALSGGKSAVDGANQQYYRESASRSAMRDRRLQSMAGDDGFDNSAIFGAKIPGMPDKPPKAPPIDEENPMGGQMFKKMMEKAKMGPSRPLAQNFSNVAPGQSPAVVSPPISAAPVSAPYSAQQTTTAFDPMAYYQQQLQAWQQQVTALAQLTALNPDAAAKITMPPPPPPPPMFSNFGTPAVTTPLATVAADPQIPEPFKPDLQRDPSEVNPLDYVPRGSGNKDAYEITNPADVYFAQLKRDSYVRTMARRSGDLETANKPFADVGVKALNNLLSKELIAQRREQLRANGGEFETSRDEMIIPYEEDDSEVDRTYTGVSYKEKLMEMKKLKAGNKQAAAPIPESMVPAPAPAPATYAVTEPNAFAAQVMSFVDSPKEVEPAPAPAPVVVNDEKSDTASMNGKSNANFALEVPSTFDDAPVPAPSAEDSEETRRKIRTLMGLILKHRGGPGFGHGRLQGNEAGKFMENIQEVMTLLKAEAGIEEYTDTTEDDYADIISSPSVSESLIQGRIAEAIACADAALRMYKSMDAESQNDLLIPVRNALASTVKIITQELEGSLSTNTEFAAKPMYATTMEFPDTYRVTKPTDGGNKVTSEIKNIEKEKVAVEIPSPGNNGNTLKLEKIYNSLKSVSGDGKYGLRAIDPDEATHIKDVLIDMRSILMDELENGI